MHKLTFFYTLPALLVFGNISAQVTINNPSFEGTPSAAVCPKDWVEGPGPSTPDLLPGILKVEIPPYDGQTYVGLITREDGTCENIAQRLSPPLQSGTCYRFSIYLASHDHYASYNEEPPVLRIWSGKIDPKYGTTVNPDYLEKNRLLASSPPIIGQDWKEYIFQIVPQSNAQWLILEASWSESFCPGNDCRGNLLLDKMSNLQICKE